MSATVTHIAEARARRTAQPVPPKASLTITINLRRRIVQVCEARGLSAGQTATVLQRAQQMFERGDLEAMIVASSREAARHMRDGGPKGAA